MAVSQSLSVTETSVSTLGNYSKVKIVWKSTQTGGSYNDNQRTAYYYITVNGGTKTTYSVTYTLPLKSTETILSKTITVPHKEDGAGTIKVETWMDTRISAGEVELSKTLKLTAIPRASTIGATDAYIGGTSVIAVSRKDSSYTHSIALTFRDVTGYLDADGNLTDTEVCFTATSIPFAVPTSFYDAMTDSSADTCTLVCRTYSGDTQIGSDQSASFKIKADPEVCSPVLTCSVADSNETTLALTGDESVLIRYHSTAYCVLDAQAQNSASIVARQLNGQDTMLNAVIPSVSISSFTFCATDSRGFTTEQTLENTQIPYIPLTLNPKVTRTDPTSGNAILEVTGQCYGKSFGAVTNGLTLTYSVDGGEAQEAQVQLNENELGYQVSCQISGLSYQQTCTVAITLADALEEVTQTVTVQPGIPVFDWGEKDFVFHVPVSVHGNYIRDVCAPELDTDAANKAYTDSKISITKVWTNSTATSEFGADTVSLEFASTDRALVYFREGTDAAGRVSMICEYGITCRAVGQYGSAVTRRGAKMTADGITFTAGDRMLTYGEWETANKVLIPVVIYKIAGVA